MDNKTVIKANEGLSQELQELQSQVAKYKRMLEICYQVINSFGHFVPSVIEQFKEEIQTVINEDSDE